MLILRVEFDLAFERQRRGSLPFTTDEISKMAANQLVALAGTFPDMVFPCVEIVASILGYDMGAFPGSNVASVMAEWKNVSASERSTAYVCEHCQVSSLKELWGPGRITCPVCKKMANAADGSLRP